MAASGNHERGEIWPALETATWLFDRASFVLIGSLLLGALATMIVVWMGIVKEHHWDVLRDQSRERIAQLGLEAEQAKGEIAKAHARTEEALAASAKANADTAKANERTAELKLALEREVAARQPRTISPEQRLAIVGRLKNTSPKGPIMVVWKAFDEEAAAFGKQVLSVLQEAGFEASEVPGKPMTLGERGAWIVIRDWGTLQTQPSAIGAVQAAFREVLGIEFNGVDRSAGFPDVDVTIAIGAKP